MIYNKVVGKTLYQCIQELGFISPSADTLLHLVVMRIELGSQGIDLSSIYSIVRHRHRLDYTV